MMMVEQKAAWKVVRMAGMMAVKKAGKMVVKKAAMRAAQREKKTVVLMVA